MALDIEQLRGLEELTPDDKKELQALLANKSLERALGCIVRVADSMNTLTVVDLSRPEGVNDALAKQGAVRGILQAVQHLIDLGERNVD